MASRIRETAAAIVAKLEAGRDANAFTFDADIDYGYQANWKLEALERTKLNVLVLPVRSTLRQTSRAECFDDEITFDVIARKKFADVEIDDGLIRRADIEKCLDTLEEMNDYLADPDNQSLTTTNYTALWLSAGPDMGVRVPWDAKHLNEWHQYTGVLRVMYRIGLKHDA